MAKPTLGRGLGDLLGSNRIGNEPTAPTRPPGVGLRILINGASGETEAAAEAVKPDLAPTPATVVRPRADSGSLTRLLAVFALLVADLALLGWAAQHAWTRAHAFEILDIAACAGTLLVGMLCGTVAARLAIESEG